MKNLILILFFLNSYNCFSQQNNSKTIQEIKQTTEYKEWHSALLAYTLFNYKKFNLTTSKVLNKSSYYYILNELGDNKAEKSYAFRKKLATYDLNLSPDEVSSIFIQPITLEAKEKMN
ncbi:hypothetical protein [Cellulophaga fucicola]|uniref:Uncharacterized protein n=1 Tax=Cellulophaga fucicola TaxID=76595 RepID=A0A1K1Q3B3_9FLAO|nr:hypothetical protein [Cellulophaga fucicola]SFW53590.1 hypothetical protein SAMN05660313_02226 [Cellulophaga fucicola]